MLDNREPFDRDFNYMLGLTAPQIGSVRVLLARTDTRDEDFSDEAIVETNNGFFVYFYERSSIVLALQPLQDGKVLKHCEVSEKGEALIFRC